MDLAKSPANYATAVKFAALGASVALLGALTYLAPRTSVWVLGLTTLGAVATLLIWRHPEIGLLAISFFGANLILRAQVVVSTGGFNIDPADVLLVGMLAIFVFRSYGNKSMVIPSWSILGPLGGFAGLAVFSALYARFYQGVAPALIVGELRPALYCAVCAITAATLVSRRQLVILLVGLFILADLTAGAIILHQFTGIDPTVGVSQADGTWQISSIGSGGFGSVRVVPAGHVLLFLMANIALCLMLRPPKVPWVRPILILQIGLLGISLVLTYTRAQWIASGIALLVIGALLPRSTWAKLGRSLVILVPLVVVLVWFVVSEPAQTGAGGVISATVTRLASIITPSDTLSSESLEWRLFEIDAGTNSLLAHPLLGVGVGNNYRSVTLLQGEANGVHLQLSADSSLTRWIHDSYLYVAVKMGLIALGLFFWFAFAMLVGGIRTYLRIEDTPEKFIALGITASFVGLLGWVVFEAHLMLPGSMMTLGLMVGLVAAIRTRGLFGRDGAGVTVVKPLVAGPR